MSPLERCALSLFVNWLTSFCFCFLNSWVVAVPYIFKYLFIIFAGLMLYHTSHLFSSGYFGNEVSQTICPA
jgi:hypothetical protein